MSEPNFLQQAGNFAANAEIDSTADNFINEAVESVASRIPGEQAVDQALITEVDTVANNFINSEVSNIEGEFGGQPQQ